MPTPRRNMSTSRRKTAVPNAIEMLQEDHKKVQKLFKQFEKLDDDEARSALVEEAVADLKVHTTIEEQVFYPAAREALGDVEEGEDLLNEANVEHESAKALIEKLAGLDASDPNYAATFTVLDEYVSHHIKEEESELFPKLKRAKLDVEALAEDLREAKERCRAELGLQAPDEEAMEGEPSQASSGEETDEEEDAESASRHGKKKSGAHRTARSGR